MSTTALPTARRYVTLADAAEYLTVTERTVRAYVAEGRLTGYRLGPRAIRIDLTELESLLVPIPTAAAGDAR